MSPHCLRLLAQVDRRAASRARARAGNKIAASIPNFLVQEQVSLGEGYLKKPFKLEDGYVRIPTAPGLGIELDEEQLADKIDHDWRNPETYDPDDGSVVDW